MLSNDELAARAGVHPWNLRDDLTEGDPGEISAMAIAWAKAGGHAEEATAMAQEASQRTADSYTVAGVAVHDPAVHDPAAHVAETNRQLGLGGEEMYQVATLLDGISDHLTTSAGKANTEITALDGELQTINNNWTTFIQQYGRGLPPEDRQAARESFISQAVEAVSTHGATIKTEVDTYEEFLSQNLRSLADLGIIPPDPLDFGLSDIEAGAGQGSLHDYLLAKYQVSVDPDGMVMYPSGVTGWLAEQLGIQPLEMTASEARHLEDRGLLGAADAYGIYKTAIHDAENVFDGKGLTDGHSDAFRYAYWNAMLSHRFGEEWTASYTTAHERKPEGPDSHATAEAMDLHNNEVGRRIAAENPDANPGELSQLVSRAVENGEMVVVNAEGRFVRSNEVGLGETGRATDTAGQGGVDPPVDDTGHRSRKVIKYSICAAIV